MTNREKTGGRPRNLPHKIDTNKESIDNFEWYLRVARARADGGNTDDLERCVDLILSAIDSFEHKLLEKLPGLEPDQSGMPMHKRWRAKPAKKSSPAERRLAYKLLEWTDLLDMKPSEYGIVDIFRWLSSIDAPERHPRKVAKTGSRHDPYYTPGSTDPSEDYLDAIELDASHDPHPTGQLPSVLTNEQVAKDIGTQHATVRRWRETSPEFLYRVSILRRQLAKSAARAEFEQRHGSSRDVSDHKILHVVSSNRKNDALRAERHTGMKAAVRNALSETAKMQKGQKSVK